MIIKKLLIILLLFIFNAQINANQNITLYLDWLNQFQFAGYYIAKEKGYYENIGLNVEIKESNKDINILDKVINNENSYGIGKSSLILDTLSGKDIILLSSIYQSSPLVLLSLKSLNIKTIKDLKNKKIMITNDAIEATSIKSMITSQNLNLNDIKIQKHTFNIEDLINGKTDVMACYLSNEPHILEKRNIEYNIIDPNEYNFNFYEGILFTSKKELLNNSIRVQDFNEASLKGWKYAFENIEETAKIIFEKYNTRNKSLEDLIYEGKILKKLSKYNEGLLGDISAEKIDEIKKIYTFLGLNKDNNKFDTNSIILNKTKIILNKEKLDYLRNNHFTLLVEDNKIPFSFKLTNEFKGIEIDFWDFISKKLNKPFNLEETISNKLFNIFSNTIKARFVYSLKKITSDKYILSNSIAQIPIAIVTKNDKNYISDLSVLENVKIGVFDSLKIIPILEKEYPNIKFVKIDSIDNGFYKLKNNEIFGFIDNIYALSHNINKNKLHNLKINTTLNYFLNMFLQVENKDKEFVELVNYTISKLTKNEQKSILNNYQQILYHDSITYLQILKFILPLVLLLIIFLFFNLRLKKEIEKRKKAEIELLKLANKDSLTNIYNRRKIEEICEHELLRSKRYLTQFSIIFFDLNDFKLINDKFGHHIGDVVLIKVAQIINKHIRQTDSFGRWGGDEFLIVLPQTNKEQTKSIIFGLERNLNTIEFEFDKSLKISCSFGFTEYEKDDTLDSLLKKADESMYIAKANYKKLKKNQSKD
ncbi:MAG: diguanylate cyclase [Arcobacter sp.]|jgi:polar amino acid transport system substrate-binding protein|uniref:ABC transporter substrate-binding protein n=1 Tax=Arcobacter sp. TaxID=1872629 RepID=UPI002A75306A|nr:ABC transporter substrate-binding protein [Arcobacter sp.]MDY3200769.1 diguanylate cyclase [Arcobacter sp.]